MKANRNTALKNTLLIQVQDSKNNTVSYPLNKSTHKGINIAITGRLESWLENSESRYPQSCTVISVDDSMEGDDGIEQSWIYVSKALRYGAGVAVDLSNLRPEALDNGRGLKSSGLCSFMQIYSKQNEILRRGGWYKNGAIVVYCDASHRDIYKTDGSYGFINYPSSAIPWIKRAVYIDDNPKSPDYILNNPFLTQILDAVRAGTIWLSKKRWEHPTTKQLVNYPINPNNPSEYRVYTQVCTEILLQSRGTCLLSHVNLGKCTLSTLVYSFVQSARALCRLHKITGAGRDNYYLPPKEDKQVGLGVVGLANLLANMKITYKDFTDCLYDYFTDTLTFSATPHTKSAKELVKSAKEANKAYSSKVIKLVHKLQQAFLAAAEVGKKYNMVRMFTIAPTATCSYNHVDKNGYTTTPEISPPICHATTKISVRDSDTFGQKEYQYPPNVETAEQVGWETYYKLAKSWQMLMNSTNLAHSISFNVWNQCPVDLEWFTDWLESPLVTTYYRMLVDQSFNDKSSIESGLSTSLIDSTDDFFIPLGDESDSGAFAKDGKVFGGYLTTLTPTECAIENKGYCAACAE